MSNPAWGSVGATVSSTTGAVTPIAPAHVAGDWLYIVAEHVNAANGVTPTLGGGSSFTLRGAQTNLTTASGLALWRAKATGPGMTIPSIGGNAGQDHIVAAVFVISGAQNEIGDDPAEAIVVQNLSTSAVTAVSGAQLPELHSTGVLVVDIISRSTDSAAGAISEWANSSLTDLTERFDAGTTDGNGGGFAISTGVFASPGTPAQTTATSTGGRFAAISLALRSTIKATASVTGAGGTGTAGTVAAAGASVAGVTGANASASGGSIEATGAATAQPSGAGATSAAGTIAASGGETGVEGDAPVSGAGASADAGDITATGAAVALLPGAAGTAYAGAIGTTGAVVVPPPRPAIGGGSVAFAGPLRRSATARMPGAVAQAVAGRLSAHAAARALLAGIAVQAEIGRIGSQGAAIASVRGSRGFGFAGAVRARGIEEITDDEILVLLMAIEP